MVEIGVLRTGKALPYRVCFLLVTYSWVFFFFFLSDHILQRQSIFTSGLLDKNQ